MKNRRNYYRILHVQPDAPPQVIRSSYRTMMQSLKMHPDLGGDHETAALVNEAYAVLMDPEARAKYDESLEAARESARAPAEPQRPRNEGKRPSRHSAEAHECLFCGAAHHPSASAQTQSVCARCKSPLCRLQRHRQDAKHEPESKNQRIIERIRRRFPVTVSLGWPGTKSFEAHSEDVSLNGMQLVTDAVLRAGEVVKLESALLDAVARVVSVNPAAADEAGGRSVRLDFLTLRIRRGQGALVSFEA